jgi:hypothetical protein
MFGTQKNIASQIDHALAQGPPSPLSGYWVGITWLPLPRDKGKFLKYLGKKSTSHCLQIPPGPTMLPFVFSFPSFYIYTHVSCYGFFHSGHKEFGNLLITDFTSAIIIMAAITKHRRLGGFTNRNLLSDSFLD